MLATIETIACSFNTNQTDAAVFKKRMENPHGVRTAPNTSYYGIWKSTRHCRKLPLSFFTDN